MTNKFDLHDLKVIGFHILVAVIQAALTQLKLENFGQYQVFAILIIQVASEAVRRWVV